MMKSNPERFFSVSLYQMPMVCEAFCYMPGLYKGEANVTAVTAKLRLAFLNL